MAEQATNDVAQIAAEFVNNTSRNVFLTGKAGTGKTTFLKALLASTYKNAIVVAPTGIAAINAGGVTIHSQFQLPFGTFVPDDHFSFIEGRINTPVSLLKNQQMGSVKRKVLRELELLIIDEVSMLRADTLDAIDTVLRAIRRKRHLPFGGVQVLFIGDLLQLPPVVKREEMPVLSTYYKSLFFFEAHALKPSPPVYLELNKIYRQSDEQFINVLNRLRDNELNQDDAEFLRGFVNDDFEEAMQTGYIFLTTHNRKADALNFEQLQSLEAQPYTYKATIKGDFPDSMFPIEPDMELRHGAQVMFIKNDYSGKQQYYNGKIGTIKSLSADEVIVGFDDGSDDVNVEKYLWENKKYVLNEESGEIEDKLKGSFLHYPLRLAWAITIHKSQGLTFDKAIIDVEKAFAPGQVYVALSRLTSLEGLILTNPMNSNSLRSDANVSNYISEGQQSRNQRVQLNEAADRFMIDNSISVFDFSPLTHLWHELIADVGSGNRSVKQKDRPWMEDKVEQVNYLVKIGNKFIGEIQRIADEYEFRSHLIKRLGDAENFFTPLFEKLVKAIALRIYELKEEKAAKTYQADLKEIQTAVKGAWMRIDRHINSCKAIVEGKVHKRTAEEAEERIKEEKKAKAKRTDKTPTHLQTLKLLQDGKTKLEVSKERELAIGTVESHIIKCIESGDLDFKDYVDVEKIQVIQDAVREKELVGLANIREHVGSEFTFFEIKIALAIVKAK